MSLFIYKIGESILSAPTKYYRTETYRYFQTINTSGKFSEYKSTHWPTQR